MSYTSENDPLLSSSPTITSSNKNLQNNKKHSLSIFLNRLALLLIFSLLLLSTVYLNSTIKYTQEKLTTQTKTLSYLSNQVSEQEIIIRRFNSTITNKDVLHQVNLLQEQLKNTEENMTANLKESEDRVDVKLKNTMGDLHEIVSKAQIQIQAEVDTVHHDVESYVRTTQDQFSTENSFMIYQLAGTFTLLGGLISMWHMTAHLRHFYEPTIQRKVLAILWMCPIYGVTSWLSLVFISAEGYLGILKDFYEAYVIYTFLSFLIAVLGKGDRDAVIDLLATHADHLADPRALGFFCKLHYDSPRAKAALVLTQCQAFAMQFVFLKPTIAIARFLCKKMDWHGFASADASSMDFRSPEVYFLIFDNISVFFAFSGLLKFYHAVQEDIYWCRPFPKFLCIKGVVFMTFWQGLVISILASTTQDFGDDVMQRKVNAEQWAFRAQDFLICLEMLVFSLAHFYVFPVEEWKEGYRPKEAKDNTTFIETMAMKDFVYDLKLVLSSGKGSSGKVRHRNSKKKKLQDNINGDEDTTTTTTTAITTIPEQDEETVTSLLSEDFENTTQTSLSETIAPEDDDEDDQQQQQEAITRAATTRLLSSRSLLSKLTENEEIIQHFLTEEQQAEEGGFVKVDEQVAALSSSSSNVDLEKNEEGVVVVNEPTSLLNTNTTTTSEEEEKLRPSIFTSLGM